MQLGGECIYMQDAVGDVAMVLIFEIFLLKCPLLSNDAAWTIFKIFQVPAFVDVCTHISQFYQFPLVHLLLQCLQVKSGCK